MAATRRGSPTSLNSEGVTTAEEKVRKNMVGGTDEDRFVFERT
jgi:hypothetical protein